LFTLVKPGIREIGERVFRYPNGSTSNEYHWNGDGHFDADSVWVASDSTFSKGWVGETVHRGTSKNHYGFVRQSLIDDGDTNTFWWSNPDHPDAPGWFDLDLYAAKSIDSLALWLGDLRPDSVQIVKWTGAAGLFPAPHQQAAGTKWVEVARLPTSAFVSLKTKAFSTRYIGVRPLGNLDHGWQVREFRVLRNGTMVSNNIPDGANQTYVTAVSTIAAARPRDYTSNWDFETFMAWIEAYPGAQPMICVNYGGGTPQEAAAWVHYANVVKHYGIRRWQIGNEIAGDWEDGGPVSARQYATRFAAYAKAMKAADSTIQVEGPVFPSDQFVQNASGDFDGRSWMEGFLTYVDSVEKHDGIRLADGIDFHTYPYWFSDAPVVQEMVDSCDGSGAAYDTLQALVGRSISAPGEREILMTEYNTSTVNSSAEQTTAAGTATGLQLAHFIQRFGDRGVSVLWELFEGGGTGPDGTWGTLSEFDNPTLGEWSSLGDPPSATFWPKRTILREWLDTAGGDTLMTVDQVAGARMFAVRNHGRVSLLAFNLKPDSAAMAFDPSMFPAGDILSWGTGEFNWIGTTTDAQAAPDNGPSSRPIPTGWDGSAKIPPYGFLVLRGSGRNRESLRTVHWQLANQKPTIADTVTISGWSLAEGSHLAGGTWSAGAASGKLVATDGAWDGPSESWTARIPANSMGTGSWSLAISVEDSVGDTARDSTSIQVTGTLRPVLLISDFDNKKLTTTWGSKWTSTSVQSDSVAFSAIVDTAHGLGSPFLLVSTRAGQPSDLGYNVYTGVAFSTSTLNTKDTSYNLVGLVFDLKTTQSSPGQDFHLLADQRNVDVPGNYNNYFVSLPNTQGRWIRDTALFQNFHQAAGWGLVVPFSLDSLYRIEIRAENPGNATISLDNVAFLGTKGADYRVGLLPRAAHVADLALQGHRLQVGVAGNWTLRLVSADGRTLSRWTGTGPTALALPRMDGTAWALLEGPGLRRMLSIPPVGR
jgi:hypothetical protein